MNGSFFRINFVTIVNRITTKIIFKDNLKTHNLSPCIMVSVDLPAFPAESVTGTYSSHSDKISGLLMILVATIVITIMVLIKRRRWWKQQNSQDEEECLMKGDIPLCYIKSRIIFEKFINQWRWLHCSC